jgi:hypothetical protein
MEVMAYLLRKAEQARRLAAQIPNQNDPAVMNLIALAAEFEARAQRHANHRRTTLEIEGSERDGVHAASRRADQR